MVMNVFRIINILLGGDEEAESVTSEIDGETFQFLRYNGNDSDIAVAHRGKVIHTDRDNLEEVVKDRIAKFK